MEHAPLILEKVRVIELAEGIPGPVCGMQLADLGADVIKIEPPGGDRARAWFEGHAAPVFSHLNRGKRSICLDVTSDEGRASMFRLLDEADVMIVHLDPDIAEAVGIDWSAEQACRPNLVVCELSDLGRNGELAGLPGSELVHQALSGFMRYAGSRDEPCRVGYEIASCGAGMHAVQAILAALYCKGEAGEGDYVSLSVLGQLLSLKAILLAAQTDPDFWAGFHLNGPHWEPDVGWPTSDGQVTFDFRHGMRDAWAQFCRTLGLDDLPDDPEYEDWRSTIYMGDRKATHGHVYLPGFAERTSADVSKAINDLGGISVRFHDYAELLAHPQMKHLDAILDVAGAGKQVGTPFKFDGHRTTESAPATPPTLGQHDGWRRER